LACTFCKILISKCSTGNFGHYITLSTLWTKTISHSLSQLYIPQSITTLYAPVWHRSALHVNSLLSKVNVKWSRYRPGVAQRVGRGIAVLFHDRGTRRGWVVSSTPGPHFTPGKDPVPILQEAGWTPGPVCTGGKSRPHRDSIPNPTALASRYTDWATRPTLSKVVWYNLFSLELEWHVIETRDRAHVIVTRYRVTRDRVHVIEWHVTEWHVIEWHVIRVHVIECTW